MDQRIKTASRASHQGRSRHEYGVNSTSMYKNDPRGTNGLLVNSKVSNVEE